MKNIQGISRKCQSVTLLYFLFIATILHLGYFVLQSEFQSIVIFVLTFLFVYLIDKNMIVVLGLSLLFVDLMYMLQRVPEGFEGPSYDASNNPLIASMDLSGNSFRESMTNPMDLSGNRFSESMTNPMDSEFVLEFGKMPVKRKENFEAVNPLVSGSETIGREKMEGKTLNELEEDSDKMKKMLDKLKNSPDVAESLKSINGIDVLELNKLINNLNSVVNTFTP